MRTQLLKPYEVKIAVKFARAKIEKNVQNNEIAKQLNLSEHNFKRYIGIIYNKLKVNNVIALYQILEKEQQLENL